jgi:hypothetical protein
VKIKSVVSQAVVNLLGWFVGFGLGQNFKGFSTGPVHD